VATKWSRSKLLKKCQSILRSPNLRITQAHFQPNICATVTWGSGEPTIIKVDPAQDGIITCVIHELLHIALANDLKAFDDTDLEEPIIEMLESILYQSLTSRQHKWWRRIITTKLGEHH
jgi:hypothetical protein